MSGRGFGGARLWADRWGKVIGLWFLLAFVATAQSAELRFLPVQFNEFGDVVLQLDATPGKTYRLETRSGLTGWLNSADKLADSARLEFVQLTSPALSSQIFRVREASAAGLPANDNFAAAALLTGRDVVAAGSNAGATAEAGEPDHAWLDPGKNSVWWKWVAPAAGRATVSVIGTYFETLLAVYTGSSPASLQPAAKARRVSKLVSFDAAAGTSYFIAVAGLEGAAGDIQLALNLSTPAPDRVPVSIAGVSVFLDELSNPNFPLTVLQVSPDGETWSYRENGTTNITGSGLIMAYSAIGSASSLRMAWLQGNETNIVDYGFTFDGPSTGRYSYSINGIPSGSGRFMNFRDVRTALAPPSLKNSVLYIIRRQTSTGPSGQQHFHTFGWRGDFHDSDGEEHAAGQYEYSASGATGIARVTYVAPLDFAGDQHTMTLSFQTPTSGTFAGLYRRNDTAVIDISGDFFLEFFQ